MTVEKFAKVEEWGAKFRSSHAGVSRIPGRQTRSHVLRVGHPDAECPRLERSVLLDDRRPYTSYRELLEKTNWDKIGVVNGVARDHAARIA